MRPATPCLSLFASASALLISQMAGGAPQGKPSGEELASAMKRAARYFAETVAVQGGYVYYTSLDRSRRLGEGAAGANEIWVQPPGTPAVGEALLDAYEASGDPYYLEAAIRAGKALAYGQLESGGWRNSIDFDPSGPRADRYRDGRGKARGKNFSTLDDDITQSALRFLMRLDTVADFVEPAVSEAVAYGLPRLLAAQYPIGAFPQGWDGPVPERPVAKASFPDYDWRTEGRIKEYWNEYTLNDGLVFDVARTLLDAYRIYGDPAALEALRRLGEFLLLAQLPEPQPGWAQQYGEAMHPIWARAFEPPAVSGRESEDAMLALLLVAEATGEPRFADPVVPGIRYLERSLLPDGRLARYYELGSNRPLYLVRGGGGYELTYDDSRLPAHYGWQNPPRIELVKAAYRALRAGEPVSGVLWSGSGDAGEVGEDGEDGEDGEVAELIASLDSEGRWVSVHEGGPVQLVGQPRFAPGEAYLSSEVFARNLARLARALR